jgi:catechol 2,3-dioxygenase-like lactoylglutathione lyase family enzyme
MLEFETLHHVAISVSDLARARRFYGEILGLEEIPRPDFPFDGAWYRINDRELHLIVSRDPTFRTKGVTLEDIHFAVRVKSYRAALAHLEAYGFSAASTDEPGRSMRVNPKSVTGYPQIHILDPDRNVIEINAEKVD